MVVLHHEFDIVSNFFKHSRHVFYILYLVILNSVSLRISFFVGLLLIFIASVDFFSWWLVAYILEWIAWFCIVKYIPWKFMFRNSLRSRVKVLALFLWTQTPGLQGTTQVVWFWPQVWFRILTVEFSPLYSAPVLKQSFHTVSFLGVFFSEGPGIHYVVGLLWFNALCRS